MTLGALTAELHQSETVLARTREASRGRELERCGTQSVALIAHGMGVRLQGKRPAATCDPEEIEQYVPFVK